MLLFTIVRSMEVRWLLVVGGGPTMEELLLWGKLSALHLCVSVSNLDLPWIPLVNG